MPVLSRIVCIVCLAALLLGAGLATHAQASVDTITIGTTDFPQSLDPAEVVDFAAWEVLNHLYTGLTRQIPGTTDYELALADDVQISADRLTYTFTLRPDAAFADGTPITAQTFVDSIQRVLTLRYAAAGIIEPYVTQVAATDAGELVFTLTRPVPYFLALLALPPYFPQHPDLAATDRSQPIGAVVIGNGPYRLESITRQTELVLRANPAYQLGPAPLTPTIILRHYDRSQDLRNAIRQHEVDLAWRALYPGHARDLADDPPDSMHIVQMSSTRVFYLVFNQTRAPFDDPGTREAITLLIARGDLAAEFERGSMSPLMSLVPPEFPDAYAPIWPDVFALEQAETVLYAAGYRTRGQSQLQFTVGYSQQTYGLWHVNTFAQMIRRYLNASDYISAGLFTDLETAALITQMERGEFGQAMVFAWMPIVPHPDAYLRPLAHPNEALPSGAGYATPEIGQVLDDAARLDDPTAQGALYRDVAEHLLADYALIPLFQDQMTLVAWDDIGGIQIEANMFLHYELLVRE